MAHDQLQQVVGSDAQRLVILAQVGIHSQRPERCEHLRCYFISE